MLDDALVMGQGITTDGTYYYTFDRHGLLRYREGEGVDIAMEGDRGIAEGAGLDFELEGTLAEGCKCCTLRYKTRK